MTKKPRPEAGPHTQRVNRQRAVSKAAAQGPTRSDTDDEFRFGDGFLTPKEMVEWAQIELRVVAKGAELRARELLDLTTRYSAGEITAEKADELQSRYYHRWGKAMPGAVPPGRVDEPVRPDAEILAEMDELNRKPPFVTPREAYERRHGKDPRGGTSR